METPSTWQWKGDESRWMVSHATDIIARVDPRGDLVRLNASVTGLLGYRPEELVGRKYLDLIRPDYRHATRRFYRRQLVRGQPSSYLEFPAMAKNGGEVWLGQ